MEGLIDSDAQPIVEPLRVGYPFAGSSESSAAQRTWEERFVVWFCVLFDTLSHVSTDFFHHSSRIPHQVICRLWVARRNETQFS